MDPELSAFNATLDNTDYHHSSIPVGGVYRVFFSGFIPTEKSGQLVGSWKAWPFHPDLIATKDHPLTKIVMYPYIVHLVGGRASGTYEVGSSWDVRPKDGEQPLVREDLSSDEGRERLRSAVESGKAIILQLAEDVLAGRAVPKNQDLVLVPTNPRTGEAIYGDPVRSRKAQFVSLLGTESGFGPWHLRNFERTEVMVAESILEAIRAHKVPHREAVVALAIARELLRGELRETEAEL